MVLWNFDLKKPGPQLFWEKSNTRLTLVCNLNSKQMNNMKELDNGWTIKRGQKNKQAIIEKTLEGGLEPPTLWLTATRSNQLSYSSVTLTYGGLL